MARDILTLVKPKKKRQPISFGGKGYDPRPPGTPKAPAAPSAPAVMNWQATLNNQIQQGQPIDFTKLQTQGYTGSAAAQPAPSAAAASASSAATATTPGGPLADDAQAAAARAQAIFDATQKRAALQATGKIEAADLEEAVRRLRGQRPDDERNAKTSANNAGLFYSGALVKQMGDIGSEYVRREGDQRTGFDRSEAARRAQLAEVDQQQTLTYAAIDAALAEREAARAAASAAAGTLAAPGSTEAGSAGSGSGSGALGVATNPNGGSGPAGPIDTQDRPYQNNGVTPQQAEAFYTALAQAGAAPATAQPKPKPKPGYTHVQDSGSRAGMSYKIVMASDKKTKIKVYENGDRMKVT